MEKNDVSTIEDAIANAIPEFMRFSIVDVAGCRLYTG